MWVWWHIIVVLAMTYKLMVCIYICYFSHKAKHSVLRVCNDELLFNIGYKHWFILLTYTNLQNIYCIYKLTDMYITHFFPYDP